MSLPVYRAFVQIIEQPAPDRARFRYNSEGYSALVGVSSTADAKTYPTVQVIGYQGKALLIVSCVTKDKPYRPHPFNIDGKEGCKKGVYTMHFPQNTMTLKLSNIGIKCVKKKDIADSLKQRKELRIDPFRTGFDINQTSFDFGSVRLCFQVLIEGENGKYSVPLTPVVSDPIYDRKNISDLVINKISHCVCRVDEEPEIIMLCGKVSKENTQIRFYEEEDGTLIWEDYGSFTSAQIHRQVAICFRAPKYFNRQIESPVRVLLQLRRPSDGATSMSIPFEYIPSNEIGRKRKIPKLDSLLDLARCFENCSYNPFMNIKNEEAATHRNPIVPPNTFSANMAPNAYAFNIPPTGSSEVPQIPSNVPYVYTVQPGPSQHHAPQYVMPRSPCVDSPDLEGLNASYQPIAEPMNDDFDVSQFAFALNTSLSLSNNAEEANQNNTDSFTRLAKNAIDSIYHATNNFY